MSDINKLVNKIKHYAQCYYEGHPEISDDEFDYRVQQLKECDPNNEILKTPGWGYTPSEGKKKVAHIYGGMDSIYRKPRHISGIPDNFINKIRITPKYDGISGAAYYKNGKFYLGLTRGDGSVGVDCTDKLATILDKASLEIFDFTGAIRGEFVITNENWELYKKSNPNAKSPRNVVAGIINRNFIDNDIKYVSFIVYKVIANEVLEGHSASSPDVSRFLDCHFKESSFHTEMYRSNITQEVLNNIFEKCRNKYPCDGLVLTNNYVKIEDGKFIYDEVAYKFNSDVESTKVLTIDWNRTRTGKMIPTIVFSPIDLDGATVRRCSGFNAKFILDNKIGIGSEITIMRSGNVIPDIQEVLVPTDKPLIPEICPCCEKQLEWNGVDLRCNNPSCSGSDEADLYTWITTIAPIHGLGRSMIKSFLNEAQIECIDDLYKKNLTLDTSSATAVKLLKMWRKLHEEPIVAEAAFVALNIPRLGWKSASKLGDSDVAKSIMEDLKNSNEFSIQTQEKISKCVGSATLESMKNNFDKFKNLKFIADRIIINDNYVGNNENVLNKGEVVITGKLSCKRSEFMEIIHNAGYAVAAGVTKNVSYLITNTPNSGSSKNRKADELGIRKITEKEFLEMIIKENN